MARPLRILISAGPTREPIDPVRFLSNYSTGYMGAELAREALARGHRVTVVSGPITEPLPTGARVVWVERAREMAVALRRRAAQSDAIIMAAAVADFHVARPAARKMARRASPLILRLDPTPDIVAGLPHRKRQVVAGFALETGAVLPRARRKLREKRLDLLVAQEAGWGRPRRRSSWPASGPFGRTRVRAWLLDRGGTTSLGRRDKAGVARALLDKIEALWYGQPDAHTRPDA